MAKWTRKKPKWGQYTRKRWVVTSQCKACKGSATCSHCKSGGDNGHCSCGTPCTCKFAEEWQVKD